MAEIKVAIKGDDSDIKAKFRETSEEARVMKDTVSKSMEAIGAASKNVISETGLGGVAKLLGAAGLTGAAIEFSSMLVNGFKNAISAALEFGKQVGQLRSALGGTFGGQAEYWADQIRTISGAMGSFEDNMTVFRSLLKAGLVPQDAFSTLVNIQNAAKTLGENFEQLGEKFAEIKARPEEMSRFFREFPFLEQRVRAMGGGETPTPDWMFKTFLPGVAPGGLLAPIRQRAETSVGGQTAALQEEFNKLWVELGQDLLPVVNQSLRELKSEMPDIISSFHSLAESLQEAVPPIAKGIHFMLGKEEGTFLNPSHPFGQPLKPIHDYLESVEDSIIEQFTDPARFLREAAEEHKQAAEALHRAVNPH
jgi:hypothetical protein